MKDSKDIYEILNQVHFNIEDYEKEELNDMEKLNLKKSFGKNIRKRLNLKKYGSIAMALILTITIFSQTNFGRHVYAITESKISEISYSISKALDIERDIEPYTNVVNQIVEKNGIEVKLAEVIIDQDELILTTIVDGAGELSLINFDWKVFINGKRIANSGGSGSTRPINEDETIFSMVYSIGVKDISLEENMDIRIVFDDLRHYVGDRSKKIKGTWEFEFNANGRELMVETNTNPFNYSYNIANAEYILDELRYNPVNQKIYGKIEGSNSWMGRYDIKLEGEDNLGNKVEFYLGSKSADGSMEYRYDNYYGDLYLEAEYIILAPYYKEYPEEDGKSYIEKWEKVGEEFTIFLRR